MASPLSQAPHPQPDPHLALQPLRKLSPNMDEAVRSARQSPVEKRVLTASRSSPSTRRVVHTRESPGLLQHYAGAREDPRQRATPGSARSAGTMASPATQRKHEQQLRELEQLTAQNSTLRRKILKLQDRSLWDKERELRARQQAQLRAHGGNIISQLQDEARKPPTMEEEALAALRREKLAATIQIWERRRRENAKEEEDHREERATSAPSSSSKTQEKTAAFNRESPERLVPESSSGFTTTDEALLPPAMVTQTLTQTQEEPDDADERNSVDALDEAALSSVDATAASDALDPLLSGATDDDEYAKQVEAYRDEIAALRAQIGTYDAKLDDITRRCDDKVRRAEADLRAERTARAMAASSSSEKQNPVSKSTTSTTTSPFRDDVVDGLRGGGATTEADATAAATAPVVDVVSVKSPEKTSVVLFGRWSFFLLGVAATACLATASLLIFGVDDLTQRAEDALPLDFFARVAH